MRCTNCGYESEDNFAFCQRCGAAAPEVAPVNPAADRVFALLKDRLFLAICILLTCAGALTLGTGNGIPVFIALAAIFSWLAYSDAQKGMVNVKHLRHISGTVYANYVVINVVSIIVLVCGIVSTAFLALTGSTGIDVPINEITQVIEELTGIFVPPEGIYIVLTVTVVTLIVIGAVCLVLNVFGMRKIHRFAKSVYQSIITQTPEFEYVRAARNWLIFFGVCGAISALSSLTTEIIAALTSLCSASSMIIAVILINKYFIENEKY